MKTTKPIKFIDLFAGIGGFHFAFHKLGLECVFASEINSYARNSYIKNFAPLVSTKFFENNFNEDIYQKDKNEIPNFDILCAGFPCQPFSQIGYKKGFSEDLEGRGNLFFEIAKILEIKKPRAFFLENVQHLVKHDDGRTLNIIKETIEKLDYSFYYKVIRASDFNLPQHRPRIFMVGFLGEKKEDKMFDFPKPIELVKSMSDVFEADCPKKIGYTLRLGGSDSGINDRRNWDRYWVNGIDTKIQPLHGKRMQGFPDDFYLSDSRTKSMRLLGNSVAVDAVYYVGKNLIEYMTDKDKFVFNNLFEPMLKIAV